MGLVACSSCVAVVAEFSCLCPWGQKGADDGHCPRAPPRECVCTLCSHTTSVLLKLGVLSWKVLYGRSAGQFFSGCFQ